MDRPLSAAATREDEALEASIRPRRLDEYLGQQAVREQLKIYIEAAKRRREALTAKADQGMALWRDKLFLLMSRNATPATEYFGIPGNRLVELGTQVAIFRF